MQILRSKWCSLVLGGGGFIGGHLAKRLKSEGFWVRIVDIKEKHDFFEHDIICNEYISGDLRDPRVVANILDNFDEVYQLAADMGQDFEAAGKLLSYTIIPKNLRPRNRNS